MTGVCVPCVDEIVTGTTEQRGCALGTSCIPPCTSISSEACGVDPASDIHYQHLRHPNALYLSSDVTRDDVLGTSCVPWSPRIPLPRAHRIDPGELVSGDSREDERDLVVLTALGREVREEC